MTETKEEARDRNSKGWRERKKTRERYRRGKGREGAGKQQATGKEGEKG